VGFEVPLEMLAACHGRLAQQCNTLKRLVPHVATHGSDAQARAAAAAVLRYFDTAAIDHHADEEIDLFPALIDSVAGSDAVCIYQLIDVLSTDHRTLEAHWLRLRLPLLQLSTGEPVQLQADDVHALVDLYLQHIEREEQELLPMARRLLSDEALDRVGRTMRQRRGVAAP
jgi:iron-sulfur cluster repair protein YtfE (RIC family)